MNIRKPSPNMNQQYFQVTPFESLVTIRGDCNYQRVCGPPGVYFWGFTLRPNGDLPRCANELIIYYIGKREPGEKFKVTDCIRENVFERIMQGFTRLMGGFGTIFNETYMLQHPFDAKLKQHEVAKTLGVVLYSVDGLHTLTDFFTDPRIQNTKLWMRERFIFCYIEFNPNCLPQPPLLGYKVEIENLEKEMHHIVLGNTLGGAGLKNKNQKVNVNLSDKTQNFNKVDWSGNTLLKNWLMKSV